MTRLFALAVLLAATSAAPAAPPKVDRSIAKEPAYRTKSPRYALLVFGPEGKDRVWLVHDGETLFVDRNGNGDLTERGEAVAADKTPEGVTPPNGELSFEVGELTVGGRTHKGLKLSTRSLSRFAGSPLADRPDYKSVLAKNPNAVMVMVQGEFDLPDLRGGGPGGRVSFYAGLDLNGFLLFADKPALAPVVHLGGPLEITFYLEPPTLRVGRESGFTLVVG
jgi:hypothetical protein